MNQTTSAGEAISLHSTDVIAATLSLWVSVMNKQDVNKPKLDFVGKSYDLHKAYKHLCISDEGLKDAYICVFNPESKRAELFGQYVLPCLSSWILPHFLWPLDYRGKTTIHPLDCVLRRFCCF